MKFILIIILTSLAVLLLMFILNASTYNGGAKIKNNLNPKVPQKFDK